MIFSGPKEPAEEDRRAFLAVRSAYAELLPEISKAAFSLCQSASAGADHLGSQSTPAQLFSSLRLDCVCIDSSGSVDLMYEGDVGLFTVRVDNGVVRPRTFDGGAFGRVDL
jgi:hypothetical protein